MGKPQKISAMQAKVLAELAQHYESELSISPVRTIVHETGLTPGRVNIAARALIKKGIIKIAYCGLNAGYCCTQAGYDLHMALQSAIADARKDRI